MRSEILLGEISPPIQKTTHKTSGWWKGKCKILLHGARDWSCPCAMINWKYLIEEWRSAGEDIMKGLNQQEIFLCAIDSHAFFFKEAKAKNHLLTWVECSWWGTWRSTLEQIIKVFQFGLHVFRSALSLVSVHVLCMLVWCRLPWAWRRKKKKKDSDIWDQLPLWAVVATYLLGALGLIVICSFSYNCDGTGVTVLTQDTLCSVDKTSFAIIGWSYKRLQKEMKMFDSLLPRPTKQMNNWPIIWKNFQLKPVEKEKHFLLKTMSCLPEYGGNICFQYKMLISKSWLTWPTAIL